VQFGSITVLLVILVLAVIIAFSSLRIANEYERGKGRLRILYRRK